MLFTFVILYVCYYCNIFLHFTVYLVLSACWVFDTVWTVACRSWFSTCTECLL